MINKVFAYMQQHSMLPENGNIVAGVSGGPDSVCLLLILVRLRERCGLHLSAVHINHGLRTEAGMDADFVRRLCREWDVPLAVHEADVGKLSAELGIGSEEAGRRVRYAAFLEQLERMDAGTGGRGCIAVAHNRDDQAETLLFHLLRGTGLDGMAGMRPVRRAQAGGKLLRDAVQRPREDFCGRSLDLPRIIRPLLDTAREEIETFLAAEHVEWRMDATNAEDMYARNRIRNRILPYAEQYICSGAKEHLAKEAELLAQTADFIRERTQEALKRCAQEDGSTGNIRLSVKKLRREEAFLQKQCVRACLLQTGSGRDLTAAHVEAAAALALPGTQSGKRLKLPICRVEAVREFDSLVFAPLGPDSLTAGRTDKNAKTGPKPMEVRLTAGRFMVPGLGKIEVRLLRTDACKGENRPENAFFLRNIPEKKYTKWVDYDKIIESAVFRTRRQGDYLSINEALDKKSLKKYMIEEKIPANDRERLMLLADGAHIIWVPGHRISAAYKVTAQTALIMEIRCINLEEQ